MRKVPTGVQGLDEMLGGGFPEGRVILLCGGPGSGKTILSLQYLTANVARGERGFYVSLEEPLDLVKQNVASFNWNLEELDRKGSLRSLDLHVVSYGEGSWSMNKGRMREDDGLQVIKEISKELNESVKHFVLDPITSITIHQAQAGQKRYMIGRLIGSLRKIGCTSIFTMEAVPTYSDFYLEEFLADGVIILEKSIDENYRLIRTLRIEKMRGIEHDDQPRRYEITHKGIIVYHTEPVTG